MKPIKTSELSGAALDWAVAKCEGFKPHAAASLVIAGGYTPSTNWAQGGPIIEREMITVAKDGTKWLAAVNSHDTLAWGTSYLIAAMCCYVASKLGDTVEVPDELAEGAK